MKQSEFKNIFRPEFEGFTIRMWLDYCDEHKDPFSKTKDYAGYVIENLKYLVKRFNKENK